MLQVQLHIVQLGEDWLLVKAEADSPTLIECVLAFAPTYQLILHAVINIQQVVGVFTGIPCHLLGEGPKQKPTLNQHATRLSEKEENISCKFS